MDNGGSLEATEKDKDGHIINNVSLSIGSSNDPEEEDSNFTQHKRYVIRNVIESNLNQAITSYSRNTGGANFYLPVLSETDWDKILNNVSIITFLQDIPIGLKYYNNYTIATSTLNNEFVDPDEIYLNAQGDNYYHMPYCTELNSYDLIGYRNTDYVQKSEGGEKFYKHYDKDGKDSQGYDVKIRANEKCYYCLIERAKYKAADKEDSDKQKAYYTALARERYIAKKGRLPAQVLASFKITGNAYDVETGDTVSAKVYIERDFDTTIEGESPISSTIRYTDGGDKYTLRGDTESIIPPGKLRDIDDNTESTEHDIVSDPYETVTNFGTKYPAYTTDNEVEINVNTCNGNSGVTASYSLSGNPLPNIELSTETIGSITPISSNFGSINMEPDTDGEIKVKLYYKPNYTVHDTVDGDVWINIDDSQNLTIVTQPKNITGKFRLQFKSPSEKVFYSKEVFEIKPKDENKVRIACKVKEEDEEWKTGEWQVAITDTNGTIIKTIDSPIQYYTLDSKAGLKYFADATNDSVQAKTAGRSFYLINNIENVGNIDPINENNIDNTGFKGYFSGIDHSNNKHKITHIEINNTDGGAYGLFGRLEAESQVENLEIDNIKVDIEDKDAYVGGLAGYAASGGAVNDVTIKDSNITGTTYVGGIIGYSEKKITAASLENSTVKSIGKTTSGLGEVFVGGLVGKLQANSVNGNVRNLSNIGGGDIKVVSYPLTSIDWLIHNRNKYYVGGLVGYTASGTSIGTSTVENNCTITGGKITYDKTDDKGVVKNYTDSEAETYTGGFIGYNNGISFSSLRTGLTVSGYDNVGGIVGFNTGGTINNVTFEGTVNGGNMNSAGIVACNNGSNISNCLNKGIVNGNKNAGGIVGTSYGGWIDLCKNENRISGKNTNTTDGIFEIPGGYFVGNDNCTGTGGIAGKLYSATISRSYNKSQIDCNYNGGGIAGISSGGTIKYCFNSGAINSTELGRLGGICGAGNSVTIDFCYNIGNVNGQANGWRTILWNNEGGIIGFVVDNNSFLTTKKLKDILNNNDTSKSIYNISVLSISHSYSYVRKCYSTGNISAKNTTTAQQKYFQNGIIGCIAWAPSVNTEGARHVTINDCYYLRGNYGAVGSWSTIITGPIEYSGTQKLSDSDLKNKLYNWATSGSKVTGEPWDNNKYIYNTISPLESGKGFEGYGVLWWEIDGYVKLEAYVCSGYETPAGVKKYVKIRNDHNTTFEVGGKKVTLDDSLNIKRFSEGSINLDTHCWIMMISKGNYNFKAYATNYGEASDSGKNISRNTKLFALLRTGSDSAVLGKSGGVSYNWNVTETRNVPTRRTYKDGNHQNLEWLPHDLYYTDSNYSNINITYNAKVGNSQDNLSTSKIAKIHLGGGTLFNNARPDLEYSWNITCNGWHRVWVGRSWTNWDGYEWQRYEWTKSISEKEEYNIINAKDKGRKPTCNIVIPMESLVEKTRGKDLPFTEGNCEVTRGDLTINYTFYMDDNIISKADFTGFLGNVLDSRGTLKDNFNISANYEGVRGNFGKEIQYSLYTTSDRARTEGASIKLNVKDVIGVSSGNLIISTSWDAVYVGMYLEINSIDLEVEYAFVSGEAGTISYYNL